MKTIYLDIAQRLRDKVQELRYIDIDKGQLDIPYNDSSRPAVLYPCALISIDIDEAHDLYDNVQECRGSITVRIAQDLTAGGADTAMHASPDRQEVGLSGYDLVARVYSVLQGYETQHFQPLTRRSQRRDYMPVFAYRILFSCEFEDHTAQ